MTTAEDSPPAVRTAAQRELIAAYVSTGNECQFCASSHAAFAAAFCMFNRYVDGLAAVTPDDPEAYARMASRIVEDGYVRR